MSAIAGIVNLNNEAMSIEPIDSMMGALEAFPADDIQAWRKGHIFLGNHAQWITPESVGEQQPYYDTERQLVITSDAVIDNRDDLFEALQIGYEDRKRVPDSYLILLAYAKWGKDCPKHLIGDFVFVIWDEREQILFGARDFSGSRTLYFYKDHRRFACCTTIQPILHLPSVPKKVNEEWLAEYLAINSMVDALDPFATIYKGIFQLPPSYSFQLKNNHLSYWRYFSFNTESTLHFKSDVEYEEAFLDVLQRATRSRLRTHREVGSQLSGGLDSGSIVALAARELREANKRLRTYSYIPEKEFVDWTPHYNLADERPYIKETVMYTGNISAHYLDFNKVNSYHIVNDFLEVMEMPYKFFENSFWLMGIYEKAKEDNVGVLLSGARGNTSISWGPALDYYALLLKKLKWIQLAKEVSRYSHNQAVSPKRVLSVVTKKAFPFLKQAKNYSEWPMLINEDLARRTDVLTKVKENGLDFSGSSAPSVYEFRRQHYEQLFHWSATGTSSTKLSLRYGLWNRDPSNDLRVIQYCLSVPEGQYVKDGLNRALIRRSMKGLLPDKVRLNQQYRGVQGSDWLHRMASSWDDFCQEVEELSHDEQMAHYLNMTVINEAYTKVKNNLQPKYAFDSSFRILMRAIIIYRFITQL